MITVRGFRPTRDEFEGLVTCYTTGFPEGKNRFALSRDCRQHEDTIFVAEHHSMIVGVLMGITKYNKAFLTGMSVLPDPRYRFGTVSMRLLIALGERYAQIGFSEAEGTTNRGAMIGIARACGATLVKESEDHYYDGKDKLLYRADVRALGRLKMLVPPFLE